jgi:hypothetical protein
MYCGVGWLVSQSEYVLVTGKKYSGTCLQHDLHDLVLMKLIVEVGHFVIL